MNVTIFPSHAEGRVSAPPSKSMAHRLLISAALSNGVSHLSGVSKCEDVLATVDCLRVLGADCQWSGENVTVHGMELSLPQGNELILPCRESGSTMRFMLPIALLSGREVTLVGASSLLRRPMTVYEELCVRHGLYFLQNEQGITVRGPLCAGAYELPGNVSSQFVSGMLFALTKCGGASVLRILPPVESRSYILLTVAALQAFGADVKWTDEYTLAINGGVEMQARDATVEGDYSNAAFLEAFNLFGGNVTVEGLDPDSLQGDRVYRDCFEQLKKENAVISLEDCPDLAPILFAVAAAQKGGRFIHTKRLKIKESDRAETMAQELRKFGVTVQVLSDEVIVEPTAFHAPTDVLCGHNDHRIVMALAVLCTLTGGVIEGAEASRKSFPDFFERIRTIGVEWKY
ncbi:MAG: 3-phosphoshikimate 1-carboxyvinyltransferase [Clostridia bacterium]|nr:3-phosphoshikimate 1-carboxyvinyltransferase [Clostridia bacterium]